jgi:paraquat-inducible protein A
MTATTRLALSRALVATGFLLYLPANFLPVMTVTITGGVEALTVMGGVLELYESGLAPVAAVVFLASVAVPFAKLCLLLWMHVLHGTEHHKRARMAVHGFLLRIGTWAMIDLFLLSLLAAVGQLGVLASVQAEHGALFFGAMVVTTLYAAEIYKPWMIWQERTVAAR